MIKDKLNIQGFELKLKEKLDKDSRLHQNVIELVPFESFIDNIYRVIEYFKESRELRGIDEIRLQGLKVKPVLSGRRTSYDPVGIGLLFTVLSYDRTSGTVKIAPLNINELRQHYQYTSVESQVILSRLLQNFAWYIDMSQILPFSLIRIFKILYNVNENSLKAFLQEVYSGYKKALDITISRLELPGTYSLDVSKTSQVDYDIVLYRSHRAFVSVVLSRDELQALSSTGVGKLVIYYNVGYLVAKDSNTSYYYSAVLNYLVHKTKVLRRGELARRQFGRPLHAIKVAGLEWSEEGWQLKVAELSKKAHEKARSALLRFLGLHENLQLFELVDGGVDVKVKEQLGERAEKALRYIMSNVDEVHELFGIIDGKVDRDALSNAIKHIASLGRVKNYDERTEEKENRGKGKDKGKKRDKSILDYLA